MGRSHGTHHGDRGSIWFTPAEADALRVARRTGSGARIWRAILRSATPWAAVTPRRAGIPPTADDPDFVNLYDRFYAIMSDAAVLEHLAFAARLSGRSPLRRAAADRLIALAHAWGDESTRAPDYGSVYATSRLLRAAAVALDLADPWLAPGERRTAISFALGLAGTLWEGWFRLPVSAGVASHTHHAHLEWGSLGVAALALRERSAEVPTWIEAATRKFDQHLLPMGLAADGAQVEGASFWASTMTARLAFLDALERTEGIDLFTPHAAAMRPDPSIMAIAAPSPGPPQHESREVVLEPAYAQLGYHAPALLGLARRTRRPLLRRLALLDRQLGALHEPDGVTPGGERLRFALGPLALLWDDQRLDALSADEPVPRASRFPSVGTAILRSAWAPDGVVVAIDGVGRVTVHAAGRVAFADLDPERQVDRTASVAAGTAIWTWQPAAAVVSISDVRADGSSHRCHAASADGARTLRVEQAADGTVLVRRDGEDGRRVWLGIGARVDADGWRWPGARGPRVQVVRGTIAGVDPQAHEDDRRLGYGALRSLRTSDDRRSLITLRPDAASVLELAVEVA